MPVVGFGETRPRELTHGRVQLRLCCCTRGAWREPAEHGYPRLAAIVDLTRAVEEQRRQRYGKPQSNVSAHHGALKTAWRDADNRQILAVDAEGAPDRVFGHPNRVFQSRRDYDDRVTPRVGLFRAKEPSDGRLQTQRRKVVARHEQAIAALDVTGFADIERRQSERHQAADRAQAVAQVAELGPRGLGVDPSVGTGLDKEKPPGIANRRSGLRTTDWIHEKTIVLAPMPTPSETITTAASSGMRTIIRHAWRRSRITVCP